MRKDALRIRVAGRFVWLSLLLWLAAAMTLACGGEGEQSAAGEARVERAVQAEQPSQPEPTYETDLAATEEDASPESTTIEIEPVAEPRVVSYEEAELAYTERRYGEAVELFGSYTERKPENPWGHYMLGLSAWKAGDFERAEMAFERALEIDAGHVKSLLNLGRVLLDTDRPEDALARIDEALELDSGSVDGLRLKGRAYHELGRPEDAIDANRQAILLNEEDVWSMNNMGLILIEQGRFQEALPPLARAVELRGDVAVFQNNLGMALENTGHFRAAEDAYRAAVTSDASHVVAQDNLTRVEVVKEDPNLEPVDLGQLARSFEDEVDGWREALAHRLSLEEAPVDSVIEPIEVEWPDSLQTIREEMTGSEGGGEEDSGGEGRSGAEGGS